MRHYQAEVERLLCEESLEGADLRADREFSVYYFNGAVHRDALSAGPVSRYTSWQLEHASARLFVASETIS